MEFLFRGYANADSTCTREFFDVGQTVTLKWNNASTKYPSVTIVLWNPTADGLYWSLDGLDFITNVGFVQWTVPEIVGQHKLGIGNGINTHTPPPKPKLSEDTEQLDKENWLTVCVGPAGGLGNSSESKVFNIRRPVVTTTNSRSSSSTASSAGSSSGTGSLTSTLGALSSTNTGTLPPNISDSNSSCVLIFRRVGLQEADW